MIRRRRPWLDLLAAPALALAGAWVYRDAMQELLGAGAVRDSALRDLAYWEAAVMALAATLLILLGLYTLAGSEEWRAAPGLLRVRLWLVTWTAPPRAEVVVAPADNQWRVMVEGRFQDARLVYRHPEAAMAASVAKMLAQVTGWPLVDTREPGPRLQTTARPARRQRGAARIPRP